MFNCETTIGTLVRLNFATFISICGARVLLSGDRKRPEILSRLDPVRRRLHDQRIADARSCGSARSWAIAAGCCSARSEDSSASVCWPRPNSSARARSTSMASAGASGTWKTCESTIPGHAVEILRELGRDGVGRFVVVTRNADIDRGRLAEVEHLVDDIGRLEEEIELRKPLRQFASEIAQRAQRSACGSPSARSEFRRPSVRRSPNR